MKKTSILSVRLVRFHSLRRQAAVMAAMLASFAAASSASADTEYFKAATGTGTWATAANWSTAADGSVVATTAPTAATDVFFNASSINGVTSTITLNAAASANSLNFSNTAATVFAGSANTLTIGSGGVNVSSGAGNISFGTGSSGLNVSIAGTEAWTNNSNTSAISTHNTDTFLSTGVLTLTGSSTNSFSFTGAIAQGAGATGSLDIDMTGGGNVVFNSANTYSGGTTIQTGTLQIKTAGSLGTGTLYLGDTSGSANATLNVSLTGTLNTGNNIVVQAGNSGVSLITLGSSSFLTQGNTTTLNHNLSLSASAAASFVIFNGVVSGTGGLTQSVDHLTLAADNTFSGGVTLTSGTVDINFSGTTSTSSALGTGALTINGGSFDNTSGSAVALTTNNTQTWNNVINFAGSSSLNMGTGAISMGNNGTVSTETVTVTANTLTEGGAISSTGSLNALAKLGTGTLVLGGANAYTGNTTVAAGSLILTGSLASAGVTVGNNTSTAAILSGGGTVSGNLTTATTGSNVAYLAPGVNTSGTRTDFGTAGTLHVGGSLTLGTNTNLDFDLSSSGLSGNDQIAVTGGLSVGTALTFNFNELGGSLDTANKYQLITFNNTPPVLSGVTFTTNLTGGTGSYTEVYSIDGGGKALDVAFASSGGTTPTAAFFNGQGANLGTFANFDTDVSTGSAVSAALGTTTNVSFNANRNTTISTATLNSALDINSVTFGTGSGIHSGMTINGTGTLTVEATTANGNTLGNGITVATGGGNNTINTAVALNSDQTWTVTDSTSTLTVGGPISGAHMLSTAGNGVLALANASGNSYSNGTVVGGSSTLFISNTSSSATGTGSFTLTRGAGLAGTGIINSTTGSIGLGTTGTIGLAKVWVGQAAGGDTGTSGKMTLTSASGLSIANTTLTFNLNSTSVGGSGTPSSVDGTGALGSGNELVVGTTAVTFGSGDTLQLNMQGNTIVAANTPFVLFAGTGSGAGVGGSQYFGLGNGGTDANGNTILTGLTLSFGGTQPPAWYANSYVFLYKNAATGVDDIEIQVVPEPGTWALMLGGLVMLVFWQRRKGKTN